VQVGSVQVGDVWVVAGPPGAGKSTVARLLAAGLDPPGALLDKDTVYGSFVSATLAVAGQPEGLREGDWYDRHIKLHEYAGLAATVRDIRASGCPVVVVAPYTGPIHDRAQWSALVGEFGGPTVHLVWLDIDADTLRSRLVARGSRRDAAKLASYDAFVDRMRPGRPPAVPHHAIDARSELSPQLSPLIRLGRACCPPGPGA
jgi:predicted kinase